jgi:hypothetical protein
VVEAEPPGVAVAHGCDPVRWWVFDGAVTPGPVGHVPGPHDPCWEAKYENDVERGKRTTRHPDWLAHLAPDLPVMRGAVSVARWSRLLGYPVEDDPTLHGGGLHVMTPGAALGVHLDYDRHPNLPGRRRALNLIAFLNPRWEEAWGGALVLCDPMGAVVTRLCPRPSRLVAFEVSDLSYHGVEPVTGPAERVTAAVYYLSDAGPHNTRQRAMFLPARGK